MKGRALHRILTLLALLLGPATAQARCVTAADLATGIAFTREDGRSGRVTGDGPAIVIDYARSNGAWTDQRTTRLGIYELTARLHLNPLLTVGGGTPVYTWTYASRGVVPVPGQSFHARITQFRSEDIGTRVTPPAQVTSYPVTYRFLPAQTVTLSGCPYAAIPVEADLPGRALQRWIYFADLGFGLETVPRPLDNRSLGRNGLTSLTVE